MVRQLMIMDVQFVKFVSQSKAVLLTIIRVPVQPAIQGICWKADTVLNVMLPPYLVAILLHIVALRMIPITEHVYLEEKHLARFVVGLGSIKAMDKRAMLKYMVAGGICIVAMFIQELFGEIQEIIR